MVSSLVSSFYLEIKFKYYLNLAVNIITVWKVSGVHWPHLPVSFHMNAGSFLMLSFLFQLVCVMHLCQGITLDCKSQRQSCFQLPMKAYRITSYVEASPEVKL